MAEQAGRGRLELTLVDLTFDRMNILDGCEIEIATPDPGSQDREQRLAGFGVAGDLARLDHGGPLPVLAEAAVIVFGGGDRYRERRGSRIGPQPEIGAEDVSVLGALFH